MIEAFTPIIIEIKIYLQAKSITKPITRIIDKGKLSEFDPDSKVLSYFDKTKQNFVNLFDLLCLKKISETMIKIPNKKIIKDIEIEPINSNRTETLSMKQSLQKIDVRNPYQKLPQQASLLNFTQNIEKKPQQTETENLNKKMEILKEQQKDNNKSDENSDIDYENLFKIDSMTHESLQLYDPPPSFKSILHPYQKQALTWMLKREGFIEDLEEKKTNNMRSLHPLWEQYILNDESHLFFNPYSGQVSVETPHSNANCKGGILADEMGLGKTVMMISLFHSHKNPQINGNITSEQYFKSLTSSLSISKDIDNNNEIDKRKKLRNDKNPLNNKPKYAGTIIIVPLTLLSQWEEEIITHSVPNTFKLCLYYGDVRPNDLFKYDIVITTYGIVSSEYANQKAELFQYEWFRVVLDEAHYIKGRTIQIAKAVYNIKAKNRWCMTGTPIQNKLDDLFSLIHFLRLEPWSDYLWWNSYINKPYEKKEPLVFEIIQSIIRPILLRRTKKGKTKDGKSIIDLPEKEILIEMIDFSKEEANLYREVYQKSKKEFDDLLSKGTFLSNYMHVFDILTRLRQICDHPYLMLTRSDFANKEKLEETLKKFVLKRLNEKKKKTIPTASNAENNGMQNNAINSHFEIVYDENSNQEIVINIDKKNNEHIFNEKYFQEVINKIKNNEIENCVVCLGDIEDAVITLCLHVTCRLCLIRALETSGMCPLCRKILNREDFMTVPRDNKFDIDLDSKFKRSSKMEKLMEQMTKLIKLKEKGVVFSQFLGMLDLIEYDLKRNNIQYVRLDGSLSQKKRAAVLNSFKEDPNIISIMVSLKAGGVGLNLVEANHVYLLDPWWNPAVEEQAVERVHRIGQKKKVEVMRFICKESIEERMIEMHKAKKELFNSTMNREGSDKKMDRKQQNIEYFKYLMSHY